MPELPDIELYRFSIERELVGHRLDWVRLYHPFLLRSVGTPADNAVGSALAGVHRFGKRIALEFDGGLVFVFHLMVGGRFRWRSEPNPAAAGRPGPRSGVLARFGFDNGTLALTEAGTKRRASLHVAQGLREAAAMNPGGVELLGPESSLDAFSAAVRREQHTVKRALTDPRLVSGVGNAYSDEILFAAGLSPFAMTQSLSADEVARLYDSARRVLTEWCDRLLGEAAGAFPAKVTAFRSEMNVHGRFDEPCRVCGTTVQRIRYAGNECNYCPGCQTGGKIYADRALSRLLKSDWPRSVEELERRDHPFSVSTHAPFQSAGGFANRKSHRAT